MARAQISCRQYHASWLPLKDAGVVLGTSSVDELNDYSVVLWVRYGTFDALLTGDADSHVQEDMLVPLRQGYEGQALNELELLKVPHHGSKTAMTLDFLDALRPQLAIISVGKNSYGHPAEETLVMLKRIGARVLRTDVTGDIELVSDGKQWTVISTRDS
jgi:competence protein ComEC